MSEQQDWQPKPDVGYGIAKDPGDKQVTNVYVTQVQQQTQKRGGCGMGCLVAFLIFLALGIIGAAVGAGSGGDSNTSPSCSVSNPAWPNC